MSTRQEVVKKFVEDRFEILVGHLNDIDPKNKKKLAKFYDAAIPMLKKYEQLFIAEGVNTDDIHGFIELFEKNRHDLNVSKDYRSKEKSKAADQLPGKQVLIRYVEKNIRPFRYQIQEFKDKLSSRNISPEKIEQIKKQSEQMLGEARIYKEHLEKKSPRNKQEDSRLEKINRRIHALEGVHAKAAVKLLDKQTKFKHSKYDMQDQMDHVVAKRSTNKTLDTLSQVSKMLAQYETEKQALMNLRIPDARLVKIDQRIESLTKIKTKAVERLEKKRRATGNRTAHGKISRQEDAAKKAFPVNVSQFEAMAQWFEQKQLAGKEIPNAGKLIEIIAQTRKSLEGVDPSKLSLAELLKRNEALTRCASLIKHCIAPQAPKPAEKEATEATESKRSTKLKI